MNSLLDGYQEPQPQQQPQQQAENQSFSLLEGYQEPQTQKQVQKVKKAVSPVQNNSVQQPVNVQPSPVPQVPVAPQVQPQQNDVSVGEGLMNVAKAVGRGVSAVPQNIVHFGKSLVDDTATTAKNIWHQPSLIPAVVPAMGKGLIDGLVHDVAQGVVDIPEAISSAYQGRPFEQQVHVPTTVEMTNSLAKKLHEKGIYSDEQYAKALELQQKGQAILDKLPIAQTAGQFMMPAGEVANTAKTAGIGKAMLHGAGFGAVMPGGLEDKVSNAGVGAVLGGGLGLATKAGAPVAEVMKKAPEAIKEVHGQIVKSLDSIMNAPTSFDSLKAIQNVNVSENTLNNVRLRNVQRDLESYNVLKDAENTMTYQGEMLNDAQIKAIKRRINKLEDGFKAQNDFINQNLKKLDLDTLYSVQENIQNKANAVPIKDGYSAYGVPMETLPDGQPSRIDEFNRKYGDFQAKNNLQRIETEQKARLEAYKNKLIAEGRIKQPVVEKVPESIMDGYNPNENVPAIDVPENRIQVESKPVEPIKTEIPEVNPQEVQPIEESASTAPEIAQKSGYKYDIGNMSMKHGFTKAQREYIAKTVLDEYKGDLYHDVKTADIMNTEKNPKIKADDYLKNAEQDSAINLFVPDTNMKFTLYKNPQNVRTLFDKLGIKISKDNGLNTEAYQNKKNPTFEHKGNPDAIKFDGEYITDGNFLARPEDLNIKNPEILEMIGKNEPNYDSQLNQKLGNLFAEKSNLEKLTDTNTIIPKDGNSGIEVRVFETADGKKVFVNNKYAKLLDNYEFYQNPKSQISAVQAISKNGDNVGLVMPIQDKSGGMVDAPKMPYKKQSTFEKKVYKDVEAPEEKAVTDWGKKKYDQTASKSFGEERVKLETETQMMSKLKKRKKAEKAKNLVDAKAYDRVLKDGVRKWYADIEKRRYDVNKDLNEFINYTRKLGKEVGINDKTIREIMPFLRERTEIPEELNRPDLKNAWAKLDSKAKESLTELADNLSEKFEKYWKEYQETHSDEAVDNSKTQIENYISHIWDLDKKQKSMMTNYFATRSRFAKERTIKTLFDGIKGIKMENGETIKLTPKTLDYAEILKTQSDSLIKATMDNAFANEVKGFKAGGVNLVMPFSKAPSDWVTINHPALNKAVIVPVDSNFGEVITPELQNILAEMGVAIGRRINPRADFRGVYKHKLIQPEIALKRWFSNKTLAHEIGHAIDYNLGLQKSGFVQRHKVELLDLNEERINALASAGKKSYAKSDAELIAELFGFLFNDPKMTAEIAPKATAEAIEKLSKSDTLKKLLPDNFNWENAKHVLEEKTVQMFKMPVKVHPDIADTLKTVFETPAELTTAEKAFDNTNAVLKQFQLGFSGFHIIALSEGGIANLGVKRTLKILNPVEMFNAVKNNEWDIYKKDEVVKQAIDDGLQIGATLDMHRNLVEGMLEDAGLWLEKKIPIIGKGIALPFKFVSKLQKANNKILWDYFHNNYKLTTYEMLLNEGKARGTLTKAKRREIAQWVNDSYGGQVWENLGITPSGRRWEQRLFLSPDWLRSTTREALGMLSGDKTQKFLNNLDANNKFWKIAKDEAKRWGIGSITDDVTASGLRGKTARKFFLNALVYMSLYTNIINASFRAKDQKDNPELYPSKMTPKDYSLLGNAKGNKTYVFIGRNSDGTERYWRLGKKFREVPEMLEKPIEKIGGKASPMVQLTSQTFTNKSVGGFENKDLKDKEGLAKIPALGKVYAQSFLPFSLSPVVNPNKDLNAFDFFAPTSRGMTFYKGREEYMDAIKHKDKEAIKEVTTDLKRNKIDPTEVMKSAVKELRKEAFKNAMAKLDKKKKEKK